MNNPKGFFCFLLFIAILVSFLPANPFTSGNASSGDGETSVMKEGPAAVRTSRPKESLVAGQMALRNTLAKMFRNWKDGDTAGALRIILAASFLYGILHALGPGHRKTVMFSVYLARKAPLVEPGIAGIVLAVLHGGTAVAVLLILRGVSGAITARADIVSRWMEGLSYTLLIILSSVMALRAIVALFRPSSGEDRAVRLGAVFLSGLYPCPGAVLVLILALTLDMMSVGILSVFVMSLGMSIPIIAAGYLAWFGRTGLFLTIKANGKRLARLSSGVELAGYLVMLLFSLYMASPFLLGLGPMLFS